MNNGGPLEIDYNTHEQVVELIDIITYCVESVSITFEEWDNRRARGPGLYIVMVAGTSLAPFADPMGNNRWPVGTCRTVSSDLDPFYEAVTEVAFKRDGAVVVSVDGTILEQMVRFKDLTADELATLDDVHTIEYGDWMGARHMSATDTSAREDVVVAITLSEEDGRVTLFRNGSYTDFKRNELGGGWREKQRWVS